MVSFPAFEKNEKGAVIGLGIGLGIYAVMLISLFTVDSILFKMAKWKVYCSPDIHGSINRIQDLGIHGNVTRVSMGNPHCVTFGTDSSKVQRWPAVQGLCCSGCCCAGRSC